MCIRDSSNIRSDIHHGVSATPSEESHIPPELDAETVNELNNELLAVFRESDLGDGEATSDSPDPGEVTTPNPDEEDLSSVSVSELAQRMRDAIATQRKFGQNGTSKPINQQGVESLAFSS